MKILLILLACYIGVLQNAYSKELILNYGANLVDINNDGESDLIVKSRVENNNAHSYDKFDLLVKQHNKYYFVTSNGMKTIEGADAVLQSYKFSDDNGFKVTEYSRDMGDSYYSKENVLKKEYIFEYNKNALPGFNPFALKLISKEKLDKKYQDVDKIK